ncbi:MAG: protein kinase [Planctomycetes bacterium]|nr:protein kinase [Planctomycetota bacterium]
MSEIRPEPAGTALPEAVEAAAGEILLGPPAEREARFAALCAAHESLRPALLRLRADYERAAHVLDAAGDVPHAALPAPIGPYRFLRPIGEGAFGAVFLAEQTAPIRREVAIKLLHATATAPGNVSRFLTERETLARMNHPAVARIFDAGVDGAGRPYFVMEYVPGEPLHHFVALRGADLAARLQLFLAACEGVNHAHQRGVIHRDLKPQNILVGEVDGRWQPKVIDFGLAKVVEGEAVNLVHTHVGAVLGTPAYMSPEQVRGDAADVDTRTDVYALGVILYELLTSSLPIVVGQGGPATLGDLRRLILDGEPVAASVRAAEAGMPWARLLRGDLDWILRKAMAKDVRDRYASVAEFAADLRAFLAHQPVRAGPPSAVYVLRKFVRRHRVAVVAGLLVLGSLLLGLVASATLYRRAEAHARRAQEHLADFWRLADVVELEDLVLAEKELWPSLPARLAEHDDWLRRARALLAHRDRHAETVQALSARLAAAGAAGMSPEEERGANFLRQRLQEHLRALDAFGGEGGVAAAVARRAEFARTVAARTVDGQRAAWERTIAAVAASPRYGGLRLSPMLGLVPLGPDPESGLEEFAHLQSGVVPVRGADGRLAIGDDTAIVLVLLPGGEFEVGSQSGDPAGRGYDPWRKPVEIDPGVVALQPFLLGKYELTQGQVRNLGVPVQALGRMGKPQLEGPPFTARHPEESLVGPVVRRWLPQFGLRVPTCFEWEVAARAGSMSVWGFGDRPEDLQGHANVADATLADQGVPGIAADEAVRDGFLSHAPVGSLRPNRYGLHDVLGNVAEMTLADTETGEVAVLARGGSYMLRPVDCRIGSVRYVMDNQTTPELGLRPAMSLPRD